MQVDIRGLDELTESLLRLPIEENVENRAVNKAAKITKEAIAKEAPIGRKPAEKSSLHENIKVKRAKEGVARVHTGGAYHAHLVEFGRSGGSTIAIKNGKRQKVTWGPTSSNPFFTRGFEKSKIEAQQAMVDEIKKALKL